MVGSPSGVSPCSIFSGLPSRNSTRKISELFYAWSRSTLGRMTQHWTWPARPSTAVTWHQVIVQVTGIERGVPHVYGSKPQHTESQAPFSSRSQTAATHPCIVFVYWDMQAAGGGPGGSSRTEFGRVVEAAEGPAEEVRAVDDAVWLKGAVGLADLMQLRDSPHVPLQLLHTARSTVGRGDRRGSR